MELYKQCETVVFSNRAYNAIISETFSKDPKETGGMLLGYIHDDVWIVMEVLPPGKNARFEYAYFEPDVDLSVYLCDSLENQYKKPLKVLGLWHRHPGSMNKFSFTDDKTNLKFASRGSRSGIISGLVNLDPAFRLTMYWVNHENNLTEEGRPDYKLVKDIEVGDDIIPESYFQLKYYNGESSHNVRTEGDSRRTTNEEPLDIRTTIVGNLNREDDNIDTYPNENPSWIDDYRKIWELLKKNKIVSLMALILVIASIFSFKMAINWCVSGVETVISWVSDDGKKKKITTNIKEADMPKYKLSAENMVLEVNENGELTLNGVEDSSKISWTSTDSSIATVTNGKIESKKVGSTQIIATIEGKKYTCNVTVKCLK